MKLILFFVRENSYLCPSSGDSQLLSDKLTSFPQQNGWRRLLSGDQELWIHHEESNPSEDEWNYIKEIVTGDVELYAALHSSTMASLQKDISHKFSQVFSNSTIHMTLFSRVPQNDVWRGFSDLTMKIDKGEQAIREFESLAYLIKKKPFARRLSILKHRIAHLFLPIDVDLQGLIETDFKQEYWDKVVEAWKDGKAVQMLEEARRLVYGGEDVQDFVEKVVNDAKGRSATDKVDDPWREVQNHLPSSNAGLDTNVVEILGGLGCPDKREEVKKKCQGKANAFHQWFTELNKALDQLRDAMSKYEEVKSSAADPPGPQPTSSAECPAPAA
ncbi:MAG: hypothetical protein ONB30_03545 [candidate division KSB1 bacterium]|nr:hypothetical protein [candidate division KSB1 bacterium]